MRLANKVACDNNGRNHSVSLAILVTMGGSDPAGLTLMAVKALDPGAQEWHVAVVLGRGYVHESALQQWLTQARESCDFRRDVRYMPAIMALATIIESTRILRLKLYRA